MMANIDFSIGSPLIGVSVIEDEDFESNELCLDQVQLVFENTIITLRPLGDTDEIEITQCPNSSTEQFSNAPVWCKPLLGKKLQTVWICENAQGYRDHVIFAFDFLQPTIAFLAEGSVLKVFCYEQVMKKVSKPKMSAVQQLATAMHN